MSSIKQLVYNALFKCATPENGVVQAQFDTAEEARDHFITLVMAELFPGETVLLPSPASSPKAPKAAKAAKASPKKTPKKTPKQSPKEAKEAAKEAAKAAKAAEKEAAKAAKAAEKEAAKAAKEAEKQAAKAAKQSAKKSPEEKAAEKEAAKAAKEAAKEAAKAAKVAEKEAAKAAKAAEKEAAKAAKASPKAAKASPKKAASPASVPLPASPKPKKGKAAEANIEKIDPTWRKHLKAATGARAGSEYSKEMETALLAYLNGLTKKAFNATKAEEHVKAFLDASSGSNAGAGGSVEADLDAIEVEFKGKTYAVDPKDRRVYEQHGAVFRGVGYVGMAAFAEMEMPEE